ncbi:hypothetical protein [Metasolibacillus meyeri]|uniref:hypothetical protein n=1 Tax=Metasolibacillus meyeri TaxID=1071052 RepID=UPI000D2FCA4D|nr:hypothetical protein [Metasolibacillus meyeri]
MYAIGALFYDLLVLDLIKFEDDGKIVIQEPSNKSNNDALNMLYELICEEKPRNFRKWISYFNIPSKNRVKIFKLLNEGLDDKISNKDKIVQRLRAELLEPGEVTEETVILALLLTSSRVLKVYFSDYEIKDVGLKIKEYKKMYPTRWGNIDRISKEINYMDVIILTSAVLI